ncbi:MAG: hypothetical protein ABIJ42_11805 [Acidobacteriota bacterium]
MTKIIPGEARLRPDADPGDRRGNGCVWQVADYTPFPICSSVKYEDSAARRDQELEAPATGKFWAISRTRRRTSS